MNIPAIPWRNPSQVAQGFESIAANQPPGGQPDHEQDERLGKISSALQPFRWTQKKTLGSMIDISNIIELVQGCYPLVI